MFEPESPMMTSYVDGPRRQLGDRLVRRVVGRELDRAVVLPPELLHERRIEVVRVVEETQGRPGLGLEAVLDRLVVLGDRPGDAVVVPRQRGAAGSDRLRLDERRAGAASPPGAQSAIGVVVFSQAASPPATPTPAAAAAAPWRSCLG